MSDEQPEAATIEPSVYDAAHEAVAKVADGFPMWLITVAVNAAIDEHERTR